jgi:arylsulfatase A
MFSADNGPSLHWEDLGGMDGPMRCGKGTTWEGGQRVPSIARWTSVVEPGSIARQITSSMDFYATALELAGVSLPADRTIDAISYLPILKSGARAVGDRSTFYYWGKNPSPKVGLHAVRHTSSTFGNWKMHWATEGSHCEDDYPDKQCPESRGLVVLPPAELLLYNLDISPGETRNLSIAAYPEVVKKLTALKQAHEAEPDVFGRSEINRGKDGSLLPCSQEAQAAGCNAINPNATEPHWPLCCQQTMKGAWSGVYKSLV